MRMLAQQEGCRVAGLRSCLAAWCNKPALITALTGFVPGRSGRHDGQPDERSMAQRGNGFQCHVAASLNRAFVVLFQKDRAHVAEDGCFVGEDRDGIGALLDLAIEALDWIIRVDRRQVVFREDGVGEDVLLGFIHEISEFPDFWAQLVANPSPFGLH